MSVDSEQPNDATTSVRSRSTAVLSFFQTSANGPLFVFIVCALLFPVLLVVLRPWEGIRLDFTQDQRFSVSDGSRQLMKELDSDIELRLYYSDSLASEAPAYDSFARRVKDLLGEFQRESGGRITVVEIQPEPFSEDEDQAVADAIRPIPLGASGEPAYFGLAGSRLGPGGEKLPVLHARESFISLFDPSREAFLEQDLTNLIYVLARERKPVLGVITSKDVLGTLATLRGGQAQPLVAFQQLRTYFDVRLIGDGPTLRDNPPDALFLLHAAILSNDFLYEIDQYLLGGGHALLLMDPFNEGARLEGPYASPVSSVNQRLLAAWGLLIPTNHVVADRQNARIVNGGKGDTVVPVPYLPWINFNVSDLVPRDATFFGITNFATASVGSILFGKNGLKSFREMQRRSKESTLDSSDSDDSAAAKTEESIQEMIWPEPPFQASPDPHAGLRITPILVSSEESAFLPVEEIERPDPLRLMANFESDHLVRIVGIRLDGFAQTAFPGGPPVYEDTKTSADDGEVSPDANGAQKDEATTRPHLMESEEAMHVILVADADFIDDFFWVRRQSFLGSNIVTPVADNGAFLLAVARKLTGSRATLGLGARKAGGRPFERFDTLRRNSEDTFRAQEQEIAARLAEIQEELVELESRSEQGEEISNEETEFLAGQLRDEIVETRQALRRVNFDLRKDLLSEQERLKWIGTASGPLVLLLLGGLVWVWRIRTRRRRTH